MPQGSGCSRQIKPGQEVRSPAILMEAVAHIQHRPGSTVPSGRGVNVHRPRRRQSASDCVCGRDRVAERRVRPPGIVVVGPRERPHLSATGGLRNDGYGQRWWPMNGDAYVFLDANILLHFHPPDQMDWPTLCRAKRVNLVIYPLLMTEITKAKDEHPRRTIRDRARAREVWVRERLSHLEAPIRPGVFLKRDTQEPRSLARDLDLDWQHRDDRIIAHAVSYVRGGRRTFVMTNDGGLEMKLPDFGLEALPPDERLRLAPEPDPEKLRADSAEMELRQIKSRLPRFTVSSPTLISVSRPSMTESEDDYTHRVFATARDAYLQSQQNRYGYGRLPMVVVHDFDVPQRAPEHARLKGYLAAHHRWLAQVDGAQQTILIIENVGNSPATNIRLRLQGPAFIRILTRRSIGPMPSLTHVSSVFHGLQVDTPWSLPGDNFLFVDFHAKHFTVSPDLRSAGYDVDRIAHQECVRSPDLYLAVDRGAPLGDTGLNVEIFCDELGPPEKLVIPLRVVDPGS